MIKIDLEKMPLNELEKLNAEIQAEIEYRLSPHYGSSDGAYDPDRVV